MYSPQIHFVHVCVYSYRSICGTWVTWLILGKWSCYYLLKPYSWRAHSHKIVCNISKLHSHARPTNSSVTVNTNMYLMWMREGNSLVPRLVVLRAPDFRRTIRMQSSTVTKILVRGKNQSGRTTFWWPKVVRPDLNCPGSLKLVRAHNTLNTCMELLSIFHSRWKWLQVKKM